MEPGFSFVAVKMLWKRKYIHIDIDQYMVFLIYIYAKNFITHVWFNSPGMPQSNIHLNKNHLNQNT